MMLCISGWVPFPDSLLSGGSTRLTVHDRPIGVVSAVTSSKTLASAILQPNGNRKTDSSSIIGQINADTAKRKSAVAKSTPPTNGIMRISASSTIVNNTMSPAHARTNSGTRGQADPNTRAKKQILELERGQRRPLQVRSTSSPPISSSQFQVVQKEPATKGTPAQWPMR
jgi:hypothetical protein